ncbi:MAG: VanZ family protein [Clostridia bacterium]|nr:VanZ family protein [Clostridia bacterium]
MVQRVYRGILWLGVIAVAVMIFGFSAQDGVESTSISTVIVQAVIEVVDPDYTLRPMEEQLEVFAFVEKLVRKGAHFLEYAALGFFIRLLVGSYGLGRRTRVSWLIGTLYACTDELHQLFISQRAAMWQDVLLDSAGVLAGIVVAYTCTVLAQRWQDRKKRKSEG